MALHAAQDPQERIDMAQIPDKYMNAQGIEEVVELLKEDDKDVALAERTWQEICHVREHAN